MGVVNVTPDSFSDGGLYLDPGRRSRMGRSWLGRGRRFWMSAGRSTRPGAEEVERRGGAGAGRAGGRRSWRGGRRDGLDRHLEAAVAEAALDAGAAIVNDVTALRGDPEIGGALRRARRRRWC